jgi:Phosphate-selective porin O and P
MKTLRRFFSVGMLLGGFGVALSPLDAEAAENNASSLPSLIGRFDINPYALIQSYAQANYASSQWLALTDQDDVKSAGFGVSNAILGVTGQGFERATYHLAINAACTGGCLISQAWVDISMSNALRLRVGKFKTPAHWAVQVKLGQSLFPRLPTSLMARVNLPFGLNAVTPTVALGFDTGAMVHGMVAQRLEYQLGVFNGEGGGLNTPNSTLSDSNRIPGLLYAARLAYYPMGTMKPEETASLEPSGPRVLLALSGSYNVEANAESSDDLRLGVEAAARYQRVFIASEAYLLRMNFVERQRGAASRTFLGAYGQGGVDLGRGVEPIIRLEVFDRNSLSERGVLFLPSVGMNYYLAGQNLKVSAVYQSLIRARYRTQLEAHQDDNAVYDHSGYVQLQLAL